MNVQQTRDLASMFTQQSNSIQGVVTQISSVVSALQWMGPNASAFGQAWTGQHAVAMTKVVSMLTQQASVLMQQAKQQELASAGAGSASTVAVAGTSRGLFSDVVTKAEELLSSKPLVNGKKTPKEIGCVP